MRNIGIVTLWGNGNYGNRLQNYAVERLVSKVGFNPFTIVFDSSRNSFTAFSKIKALVSERVKSPKLPARRKAFDRFNKNYLHPLDISRHEECDAFVCGSDQVWNYTFPEFSPEMFLSFAGDRATASLSASFGVSIVPDKLKPFYSAMLNNIDYISVRESAGADLVKDICGRDAEVLFDPTMAIEAEEWRSLSEDSTHPSGRYVFDYFLGQRPENIDERIKKEFGIETTISFNNVKQPSWFDADPLDFVSVIAGADAVVTDSFHGAVFSILFEKPFVVFERNTLEKSMSSRLDTLLSKVHLECNHSINLHSLRDCKRADKPVLEILESERAKTMSFLLRAFGDIA